MKQSYVLSPQPHINSSRRSGHDVAYRMMTNCSLLMVREHLLNIMYLYISLVLTDGVFYTSSKHLPSIDFIFTIPVSGTFYVGNLGSNES